MCDTIHELVENPMGLFDLTTNLLNLAYRSFYALHCEVEFRSADC